MKLIFRKCVQLRQRGRWDETEISVGRELEISGR